MNEVENKCDGYCYVDQVPATRIQQKLKYIPTLGDLEKSSIPLDAIHYDGNRELDTHSLFGTMQTMATGKYFSGKNGIKKRPMIMSRSSFAGIGKYGSTTLNDNWSDYNYMAYSVTGIMAQNIAGVPLSGADICGFFGDTTVDLCAKWYTLGSFYPFSRNHNDWMNIDQEPYADMFDVVYTPHMMKNMLYTDIIRWAMFNKMSLIRYYYSEMSHVQLAGGSFYKPLFFDYPTEDGAYSHQSRNVMIGNHLKFGMCVDYVGP